MFVLFSKVLATDSRSRKMFKFSNWFVSVASFLVFFVVCEGQSTEKSKDDGVSALQPSVITLTEAEKQAIVFGHNDYRSVQRASNMQKMVRR